MIGLRRGLLTAALVALAAVAAHPAAAQSDAAANYPNKPIRADRRLLPLAAAMTFSRVWSGRSSPTSSSSRW